MRSSATARAAAARTPVGDPAPRPVRPLPPRIRLLRSSDRLLPSSPPSRGPSTWPWRPRLCVVPPPSRPCPRFSHRFLSGSNTRASSSVSIPTRSRVSGSITPEGCEIEPGTAGRSSGPPGLEKILPSMRGGWESGRASEWVIPVQVEVWRMKCMGHGSTASPGRTCSTGGSERCGRDERGRSLLLFRIRGTARDLRSTASCGTHALPIGTCCGDSPAVPFGRVVPGSSALPLDLDPSQTTPGRKILRDLGPGIPLWEFLLYWEKKLYHAGRQGRRSRTDRLVPDS
eukprot:scaffold1401_cov330-Pavlova_lutheri.AAC.23